MKKALKRLLAMLTLAATVATLSSCTAYGIAQKLGFSDRLKGDTLMADSERYYDDAGRIETTVRLTGVGRYLGRDISFSNETYNYTAYSYDDDGMKHYTRTEVKDGESYVKRTELMSYVDGYMYRQSKTSSSNVKMKCKISERSYITLASLGGESMPRFESSGITSEAKLTKGEDGSVTLTYSGYAGEDDGELLGWLGSFVGEYEGTLSVTDITVTTHYTADGNVKDTRTVFIKFAVGSLKFSIEINEKYGEPEIKYFNPVIHIDYVEMAELPYLLLAQNAVDSIIDPDYGTFLVKVDIEKVSGNYFKHYTKAYDVVYEKTKDDINYFVDVYSDTENGYCQMIEYDGEDEESTIIDANGDESEGKIFYYTRSEAYSALRKYLSLGTFDLYQVKDVYLTHLTSGVTELIIYFDSSYLKVEFGDNDNVLAFEKYEKTRISAAGSEGLLTTRTRVEDLYGGYR